jgi:hypothetical protein
MQTPKNTASKVASIKSASNNAADTPVEQKNFNDDDFDDDLDNEPLEDLDYDGVARYDDEDDDY